MNRRIGAVSYLNTKPLMYGLRDRLDDCRLSLDLPSRLAQQLRAGELDVALIPSVEFLRTENTHIVSDACIACRGPVRSVRVVFRCSPERIRTLALDEGSRTSAALAQVLLHERYGLRPKLIELPIDSSIDAVDADATLVIGDRAMQIPSERYVDDWDLGEEWCRTTQLPFVFAMWIANDDLVDPALSQTLSVTRDIGLQCIEDIIATEAAGYKLWAVDCRQYFLEQLHFTLGEAELAGLDLFRRKARSLGLIPQSAQSIRLMTQ